MSSLKDVILGQFQVGQMLIEKFTADLSDAEYFHVPFPGGNHVGWCLGHIACTEDWTGAILTGSEQRIPSTTHELFNGNSTCVPDATKYPARKELDELFRNARANLIEVLTAFDENRWDNPAPEGAPTDVFPTIGSMWGLQGVHQFWHIGHITACRAALGKNRVLSDG